MTMKLFHHTFIASVLSLFALFGGSNAFAQPANLLVLNQESFKPVYDSSNPLEGVQIDPIGKDRSNRPCVRIKLHVSAMLQEDIELIEVIPVGGNIVLMKREMAHERNGLILEMTANPALRFYIRHPRLGESRTVTVNAEGNREYVMEAYCQGLQNIACTSNVGGAKVYIDDSFKGVLDSKGLLNVVGVPVGEHKLKMTYYSQEVSQDIMVSDNSFYFRLDLYEVKMCNILSEPSGAEVYLDGNYIGKTPFYDYPISMTSHKIEAVREGVRDEMTVNVDGSTSDLVFDVQAYLPVKIDVSNAFGHASVSVDGGEWTDLPFKGNLNIGTHSFAIRGYEDNRKKYTAEVVKGGDNAFLYEWPGASDYHSDRFWSSLGESLFFESGGLYLIPMMTFNKGYDSGYGGMVLFDVYNYGDGYYVWDYDESFGIYVKYTSSFNDGQFETGGTLQSVDSQTWDMMSAGNVSRNLESISITAGVAAAYGPLQFYTGLGYGKREYMLRSGDDILYCPSLQYENCDMDLGLILNLGRFKFNAGLTFPAANVVYSLYNIANYSWDYARWAVQESWRGLVWFYSMGAIFDLVDLASGEDDMTGYHSEFLDVIAPYAPNPIKASQQKKWEWFPYNFVELNIGVGFAF